MQAWCSLRTWQRCRRHLCSKHHTGAFNRCFEQTAMGFCLARGREVVVVMESMFIAELNFKALKKKFQSLAEYLNSLKIQRLLILGWPCYNTVSAPITNLREIFGTQAPRIKKRLNSFHFSQLHLHPQLYTSWDQQSHSCRKISFCSFQICTFKPLHCPFATSSI